MLCAGRRVNEVFNIYAPDNEIVIASLTVRHVWSYHGGAPETTDVWADLEIFENREKCMFDPAIVHNGMIEAHVGDRINLFDKDAKKVLCEITVIEVKEHQNAHFRGVGEIERGRGAHVDLGSNFDNNDCVAFRIKK